MTCPGALRPLITRIRSNEVNCIRVGWKEPVLRGDVQVDSYRVGASADVHNFETRHFPYSVFATAFSRAEFFFEKIINSYGITQIISTFWLDGFLSESKNSSFCEFTVAQMYGSPPFHLVGPWGENLGDYRWPVVLYGITGVEGRWTAITWRLGMVKDHSEIMTAKIKMIRRFIKPSHHFSTERWKNMVTLTFLGFC